MKELQGIYPATVTPFDHSGAYDPDAMCQIVRYQLAAGVDGFYLCGATGEGLLLTREERQTILETVLEEVNGPAREVYVDLVRLLFYAMLENLGYRQLLSIYKIKSFLDVALRRRAWS